MGAATTLSLIADSTVDVLIAVIALSVLAALLFQALRDAGLRVPLHRQWIRSGLDWRADKRAAILKKHSRQMTKHPEPLAKDAFAEIETLGVRAMALPRSHSVVNCRPVQTRRSPANKRPRSSICSSG